MNIFDANAFLKWLRRFFRMRLDSLAAESSRYQTVRFEGNHVWKKNIGR